MSCEEARWLGILEQREQRKQQQNDDDPESEIAEIGVHPKSSFLLRAFRLRADGPARLQRCFEDCPTFGQCRSADAPCQGNRPPKSTANPAYSNPSGRRVPRLRPISFALWLRPFRGARLRRARRALDQSAGRRVQRDHRAGQGAAKPHGVPAAAVKRGVQRFELAEFDRALVADRGRWPGRAAAARSRPASAKTRRPATATGPPLRPRPRRERGLRPHRPPPRARASARRTRRASSASRSAVRPSRRERRHRARAAAAG